MTSSAAQLSFQTISKLVNLSFGPDASFVRNASDGIEDEFPFQIAPPFEQPFRAYASD
jgi:hypothetical protein